MLLTCSILPIASTSRFRREKKASFCCFCRIFIIFTAISLPESTSTARKTFPVLASRTPKVVAFSRFLTCPNAPAPSSSILAHLTIGLLGSDEWILVCGIVGTAVSALSESVRENLGLSARDFKSLRSTSAMVSGGSKGQSSLNVTRSRRSPPTVHFRVRSYLFFPLQRPKMERALHIPADTQ